MASAMLHARLHSAIGNRLTLVLFRRVSGSGLLDFIVLSLEALQDRLTQHAPAPKEAHADSSECDTMAMSDLSHAITMHALSHEVAVVFRQLLDALAQEIEQARQGPWAAW